MRGVRSAIVRAGPRSKGALTTVHPPGKSAALSLHLELARQLDALPKDLGVTLLVLGTFGVVIPGPVPPGFSFILLGIIALRPSILARSAAPLASRFSGVFHLLIGLVTHFRFDLARRVSWFRPSAASHCRFRRSATRTGAARPGVTIRENPA